MKLPQKWSLEQLVADSELAIAAFRHERLDEPLELYSQHFETFSAVFGKLVDRLPELQAPALDAEVIASLMRDGDERRAFLYLTAPPISEDDLKTISEASLSAGFMRANPEIATRVRDIIFRILDPHRFPWIIEGRDPKPDERAAAIVASAALVAVRKVETFRRTDAKDRQENRVKDLLRNKGFTEIPTKPIPTAAKSPKPGEFMGETPLTGAKADVVATLPDGRVMAIECKVSNSSVNSYKRLVHDTGGKSTIWLDQFGKANVIPCGVLNGVFSPANCETVQNDKGVFLFWDFRLDDLADYIDSVS